MKCEYCNNDLKVSNSKLESDINSTEVNSVQTLVCVNANCDIYCGTDLTNPKQIAKTIKVKVK